MSLQRNLPPIQLFDSEVNRIHQIFHDIEKEKDDLVKWCTSTSAGSLEEKLAVISNVRARLNREMENVRLISALIKPYQLNQNENISDDILVSMIETVQTLSKKLCDTFFNMYNSQLTIMKVVKDISKAEKEVSDYYHLGLAIFSGRPLKVHNFLKNWSDKKTLIKKSQQLIVKYSYLFDEHDIELFKAKLQALKDMWQDLKNKKKDNETALPETACKICYTNRINFVIILCGHVLCGKCLQRLTECHICRGSVEVFVEMFFKAALSLDFM